MVAAILLAAGSGSRLGADLPKAFVDLAGKPIVEWALSTLVECPAIDRVVVATPADSGWRPPIGIDQTAGGDSRSESVHNALRLVEDCDRVLIHDAARPFLSEALILNTLAALTDDFDAAIAATKVTDTIKRADSQNVVSDTLQRDGLWAIQTPQVFHSDALERALNASVQQRSRATDDASLIEQNGGKVTIVESSPRNFKITTKDDLLLAELIASSNG